MSFMCGVLGQAGALPTPTARLRSSNRCTDITDAGFLLVFFLVQGVPCVLIGQPVTRQPTLHPDDGMKYSLIGTGTGIPNIGGYCFGSGYLVLTNPLSNNSNN